MLLPGEACSSCSSAMLLPPCAHLPATTSTLRVGYGLRLTRKSSTLSSASLVLGSLRGDSAIYTGGHIGGLEILRRSWSAYDDLLAYTEDGFDCPARSSFPKRQMPQRSALTILPYRSQPARSLTHPRLAFERHQPNHGRWISSCG